MPYDLQVISTPRVAGTLLSVLVAAVESPILRSLLLPTLEANAGLPAFRRAVVTEAPLFEPRREGFPRTEAGALCDVWALLDGAPEDWGVAGTVAAFRSGSRTPLDVANQALDRIEAADREAIPLRAMVAVDRQAALGMAEASAARWKAGQPIGPLDGVPMVVKDEVDMVPYPTRVGTRFLGDRPASEDAVAVARLRAAGAVLLGKSGMHEIGLGVTGLNPHHGTPRNPWDRTRHTGGPSSGSAAAVGAGLCALALGADGGGSIREPSALCGVVGLKPTWGRIPEFGAAPLCWSVGHLGPIGATVRDAALGLLVMAGPSPLDAASLGQPAPGFRRPLDGDLRGVRVGVPREWFEDAEPEIVAACRLAVAALEDAGAVTVPVEVHELELARVAHLVTIAAEMVAGLAPWYDRHRTDFGLDVRMNLAIARTFTARAYVQAQKVRARFTQQWEELFARVDLLATPSTGTVAPPVHPDALAGGESDLPTLSRLMRFVFPANLLGWPALSMPVGVGAGGLPVGFHLCGRPWDEEGILRAAEAVERRIPPRRAPGVKG